MKSKKKVILTLACAVLLVFASVMGTMAYLTSQDEVVNTFTVGDVAITLDEAPVDANGDATTGERVKANEYKLIPGHKYNKDPMVTVLAGSEEAYIRATVTISKSAELDKIFEEENADLISIFEGYDAAKWIYKGNKENTVDNTRTYEFWYNEKVTAPIDKNAELAPLFKKVVVPGFIDNNELKTIEGMTITVNAHAIQADSFESAEEAWAAWE